MKKLISLISLFLFCHFSFAEPPKQLIFFGDSLTDNGNLYRTLFKILPKSPPYFEGHFTNGPAWSDEVAEHFGKKNATRYLNYAVGGATTILRSPFQGFLPWELKDEVNKYLIENLLINKSNNLFVIWMGANDYLSGQPNVDKATTDVISKTVFNIHYLIKWGAKHFLILNLPDLSRVPFSATVNYRENLHQLTLAHNKKLALAVEELKKNSNLTIVYYDIYSVFDDMLNQPAKYKIKNTIDACWPGSYTLRDQHAILEGELQQTLPKNISEKIDTHQLSQFLLNSPSLSATYSTGKLYEHAYTPCDNPNEFLFWDKVHPTAMVHHILAELVIKQLEKNA